jgi:hypothetical protein
MNLWELNGKKIKMPKFIDLSGQKFGKLTVISKDKGSAKWNCKCNCGNSTIVRTYSLTGGNSKSCGCSKKIPKKSLIGQKFERLTVVSYAGKGEWVCECECGKKIKVSSGNLKKAKSCGCSRASILTGKRFGKLTVISRSDNKNKHIQWNCVCECGKRSIVNSSNLKRGHTKSCGCLRDEYVDLTGQRFGKLTVISKSDERKNHWNCVCDCGKKTLAESYNLKNKYKSCGCTRSSISFSDKSLSSKNNLYYNYKKSAMLRHLSFSLSFEEFIFLTQQDCFFCGDKPSNYSKTTTSNGGFFYNGIDRPDNNVGYESGNALPCCRQCNRAKLKRSKEEFILWIKESYFHMGLNKLCIK